MNGENIDYEDDELVMPEEYLVRGADLFCNYGSHPRKLNLPKCHGVYITGEPVVHKLDSVPVKNISSFGVCKAPGVSAINPSPPNVLLEKQLYDEYGNPAGTKNVRGPACTPQIASTWMNTYEDTRIVDNGTHNAGDRLRDHEDPEKGYPAATTESFIVCACGGIITPFSSGQKREEVIHEGIKGAVVAAIVGALAGLPNILEHEDEGNYEGDSEVDVVLGTIIVDEEIYASSIFYSTIAGYILSVETIDPYWNNILDRVHETFDNNREIYMKISRLSGIPAELIAAMHYRENATDFFAGTFSVHLHNGQPLGQTTTIVPVGVRFEEGQFIEAALHALRGAPWDYTRAGRHDLQVRRDQLNLSYNSRDIIALTTFGVLFNGWGGVIGGDINGLTAYGFNGTDIISYGRFIADGVFDPHANPGANVGIFPILLRLLDLYI